MNARDGSREGPLPVKLHVEVYAPESDASHSRAQGSGTLVFCHGFGGSARNFRPQARAFRESVRIVLYDARGHARSRGADRDEGAVAYDLDALTTDLGWVIDEYAAAGPVILGGLSMGAATALSYTLRHPENVAGLLVASYPNPSDAFRTWATNFADGIEAEGIQAAGERFVWGATSRFDPQARALIQQGFLEHSPSALVGMLRDCLARLAPVASLATQLSTLRTPTRIVVGSNDAGSMQSSAELARLIPHATLSVLAGAGHVVNLERAAEFNDELRALVFQACT
jgi:pimeloyl-ACP methyl ester carboxylesterase